MHGFHQLDKGRVDVLHITYIVTDPLTVKIYLKPQVQALRDHDWKVSIICGGDIALMPTPEELQGISLYHVPMQREIDPLRDILALARLVFLLIRLRPAIVNAGTPKAGLLGMLASRLVGVPLRVYQLHGLRLETANGLRRHLFGQTERWACWCSHKVLCVSTSLKDKVIGLGVCKSEKAVVLGAGSPIGVQAADFAPTPQRLATASVLRESLGIPPDTPVIGFLGRLTKDKGIVELWNAFTIIQESLPGAHLLLIGPFEEGSPVPEYMRQQIKESKSIRHIEWTDDPGPYLHLMDVLVLPTYREGLPGVLLEAAASETPIVATAATGVVDVVVNEQTGLISPIGDAHSIAQNTLRILLNTGLAQELTRRARHKVEAEFSRQDVLQKLESFYMDCLVRRGIPGALGHHSYAETQ